MTHRASDHPQPHEEPRPERDDRPRRDHGNLIAQTDMCTARAWLTERVFGYERQEVRCRADHEPVGIETLGEMANGDVVGANDNCRARRHGCARFATEMIGDRCQPNPAW